MKRLLCSIILVLLIVVSWSFVVFAKGNEVNGIGHEKGQKVNVKEQVDKSSDTTKGIHNKSEKNSPAEKAAVKEKIKAKVNEKRNHNDNSIPVFIKDKEVKFDVPPVIKSGRTLIPVRAITNALGAEVDWDAKTQTVTVSKAVYDSVHGVSTTIVTLKLDSDIILINGKEAKIDVPAQLVSNRTMVPIRFIAQALNQEINYDSETGAVIVEEEQEANIDLDSELNAFIVKLKDKHADKFARKALIRKISDLKKKKNDLAIMVFVKGSEVKFDVPPVIKSGRTLIPVRAVSDALGADVAWDQETKTITITKSVYGKNDTVVEINLDSDLVMVNGKEVKIDVPAQSINNRTMVPLRFIAIVLNQEVEYDSETGAVIIEDNAGNKSGDKVIVDNVNEEDNNETDDATE